ncbi:hypothetical protein [Pseudoalteromonas spongiae]|uniref:hypothetical protein n=1 Tax=Pseudoalteromonas spongiae TaxID=298657 RepID=UPI0012739A24|nr:hypothetical protein [Pseudoalteromonas spongiae]TMO82840.1 hypothetical protein CWC15_18305 [Pseudoalteromonas spongiae]
MKIFKLITHLSAALFIVACTSTPPVQNNSEHTQPTTNKAAEQTHQPIITVISALLANCTQAPTHPTLENDALQTFIGEYCTTTSTNKQLKLIEDIKANALWPNDYEVWFDSLTWHTENLRKQKITNFYSDSKAQKHEQQLLELQRQLIELKQKLVDIEKQRLETSLSENRTQ